MIETDDETMSPAKLALDVVERLAANAAEYDRIAEFPVASVAALRRNGLMGLLVPREFGGLGGGIGDLVEVAQILASGCLSTAMIWAMHCQQSDALVRFGSRKLQEELLPRIAAGDLYLASATTEPGKGGHLLTAVSPLNSADGRLSVVRDAPVVTGGRHADGFLVTMRAATESSERDVSLVYVDRSQADLTVNRGWDALGMRATNSVGMRLEASIPAHQLVGDPGRFREIAVDSMIPLGHLGWAACWLGAARSALAAVIAATRSTNRPRGLNPGSDLAAERLARVRIDLELVGAYLHRVRDEIQQRRAQEASLDHPTVQIHLNTLKVVAAELTFSSVNRLVELTGLGTGYLRGSEIPLERHFRDLRSASLNYANDRLLTAVGALSLLDREVRLA